MQIFYPPNGLATAPTTTQKDFFRTGEVVTKMSQTMEGLYPLLCFRGADLVYPLKRQKEPQVRLFQHV